MRAIEPFPVTRFNFEIAIERARKQGEKIAAMANERHPFKNLEERLLWYDDLPYMDLNRAAERQLLADLTIQASPSMDPSSDALGLARADELTAGGYPLEALIEVTKVYEAGIKAFEETKN